MKDDLEIQARPGNNSQRLKQEDDKFKTSLHPWLHREFKGSLGISDKPPPRRKSERKEKKRRGRWSVGVGGERGKREYMGPSARTSGSICDVAGRKEEARAVALV